jgi:hypothetical protein
MDNNSKKAWERLPNESTKAFNAFTEYVKMPVRDVDNPENSRSLVNLTQKLGYSASEGKAASILEGWSSKFDWVARSKAYDSNRTAVEIEVIDAGLVEYQRELIERRTLQATLMNNLIETQLKEALDRSNSNFPVEPLDIVRLASAMEKVDNIQRRIAGMPTQYTTDKSTSDESDETRVFIIGGGDD